MGNLNFTFITDAGTGGIEFAAFCGPVQQALASFGVPVQLAGRNDMTVEGKKFSGNAQYRKEGRVMHHGTILYDSDLSVLSRALNVPDDKIESKGIKSARSRVTNIRPYMRIDMPVAAFRAELREFMFAAFDMREYVLRAGETAGVEELRERVYSQWSWNYGASPPYNVRKTRRVAGCGAIEILLDVAKEGIIQHIAFYGDFFSSAGPEELAPLLTGRHLEYGELKQALCDIDISWYFHNLSTEEFLSLLLE
jgi:lipoate-protein ligase A